MLTDFYNQCKKPFDLLLNVRVMTDDLH